MCIGRILHLVSIRLLISQRAIDRLHSNSKFSHRRVMVTKNDGTSCRMIYFICRMASGADILSYPELGYNMDVVTIKIKHRRKGKTYSIVAVAEGIK